MNSLSNGSVAVGSPGSLMRLFAAYEYELTKKFDSGQPMAFPRERIPTVVRDMIRAAYKGNAVIGECFATAAKACEIKNPTRKTVRAYLVAAGYDPKRWY